MSKEKDEKIIALEEQIAKLEKLANHYMQKSNNLENQLVLTQTEQMIEESTPPPSLDA